MTSKNEITGDEIKSKTSSDLYREGWDRIFGKKKHPLKEQLKKDAKDIHKVANTCPSCGHEKK